MGLVIPSTESNDEVDFFAIRGFGSSAGVSKIGAGIQAGRLGYKFSKWAYSRYFGYATKTSSRAKGTATGAGIGIGGGLAHTLRSSPQLGSSQRGKTRNYMVKSRTRRKRCPTPGYGFRGQSRRQGRFY